MAFAVATRMAHAIFCCPCSAVVLSSTHFPDNFPTQAPYNVTQDSFDMIFASSKLLYMASLVAYVVGNLCDIWLFGVIKRTTGGKLLWLRATGSTVLSQVLDSFLVTYLAFGIGKQLTGQAVRAFVRVHSHTSTTAFLCILCMVPSACS
jgi:uncharacterized integral membrane protein (TIGR00697 family)